ncbi:MAG: undecaprenyl-diphosphate phosphatase [Pseudomonadota bacterium]|nr:undecaprenyl-diphosphate phosphatase [Pseudomonadota bacterium]
MSLLQLLIIAGIQGITEFIPISSSGHLVIIPHLFEWRDQGLIIDIAVHFGTLAAVIVYLWRDIWQMLARVTVLEKTHQTVRIEFIGQLLLATIPLFIVGALVYEFAFDTLRNKVVVGWATILFGILLYLSDKYTVTINRLEHMTWGKAFAIGLAQVFALIPGASRAGTTITMARWLGFERTEAVRFSMLLSIPAILAAGTLAFWDLLERDNYSAHLTEAIIVAFMAFLTALVSITILMRWLTWATFTPFVIYRVILGAAVLTWAYY